MGSDCVSLHQESGRTMRWRCLGFLLLITVAGVQLLADETSETSMNKLSSEEQPLADVYLPLVKRETQEKKNGKKGKNKATRRKGQKKRRRENGKKKELKKDGKKKKASRSNGKKKQLKKNRKKKPRTKVGKKKWKSLKNGNGNKSGRNGKKDRK